MPQLYSEACHFQRYRTPSASLPAITYKGVFFQTSQILRGFVISDTEVEMVVDFESKPTATHGTFRLPTIHLPQGRKCINF